MSVAEHFDVLSIYRAAATRVVPVEGDPEDLLDEGGGLQAAFESIGQRPLVGVLRDGSIQAVLLADGELAVEVARSAAGARLTVKWADKVIVDEAVEIPPIRATWAGPWFRPDPDTECTSQSALGDPAQQVFAVADVGGQTRWFRGGHHGRGVGQLALKGVVPEVAPGALGSAEFRAAHGVRLSYVAGAMAGGIASAELVIAMANAGLIGFYGSGGVPIEAVEAALEQVSAGCAEGTAWGFNLLNNPAEPAVEERTVDLYLKHGVRRVSASAYMGLTPAILRYRLSGVERAASGGITCPNKVFAKISRPEVAEKFLRPAPDQMIAELVKAGQLSLNEAELARQIPVAEDITAEADSGGHTDHRPLVVLLPEIQALRDRIAIEQDYASRGIHPRVGAAGGLGTPSACWAALAMGADYVLTGSVNQAAVEAGTSEMTKKLLADASFYDVSSGPAPDMFEIGAKVQVLSRGSMYAQRAQKLYDLYKAHGDMADIPSKERKRLEKQIFKRPLDEVWEGTRAYWAERDPKQVEKAERDGRHKMALTFRWYLGMTSRWARIGEADRKRDFQVWCGPSMGGFNSWASGGPLEALNARTVVGIADALMAGAAVEARRALARTLGLV
jgi:PfaD family protein